jgi:long-subunit fatty acid transport protein
MKIKIRIKNCKRRGEWTELEFIAAAAKHGLQVFNPWGDSASYDAVIETRGHFVRVQVKSTTCRRPEGSYRCNVRPGAGLSYKRGDFDFVAAYVIPEDLWYIIPAKLVVSAKKTQIMLSTTSPTSCWTPYKEAWDLLRNHRRRTTPQPEPDQPEGVMPNPDVGT